MRETGRSRSWFVVATLALGLYAMLCVALPWAHGFRWDTHGISRTSPTGFSYTQGLIVFAGAFGLVVVSALRLRRRLGDVAYVSVGLAACVFSLGAAISFWMSEVGVVDPQFNIDFAGKGLRISAGNGWQGATAALAISLICFLGFATDAAARMNEFQLVLDRRALGGGSLIPNRFRVRIIRREQTVP